MIQIKELNLRINKRDLLCNINAEFENGKIHGLVGRNGSGKTILMKCICGFMRPSSGQIIVDGKILGKDLDFLPDVGVIIENPNFINYMSGYKNLKLLSEYKKIIDGDKIRETMRRVGLSDTDRIHVRKYSLGMRQRLAIAQAIMEDPEYLVLDEPFNGLDESGVSEIRKLLLQLKSEGKNIILASHNRDDINLLCDDILHIDHGKIIGNQINPDEQENSDNIQ
ncbi:MAG: ATP-binding cassette domain-containing protein [Lachnospiraceae bacterium]|nr:ATP-binding cassette domain-containing protein [Lachnospiraceae bacterium]